MLAWVFPALVEKLDVPRYPFRYIVSLNDTLAIVELQSDTDDWTVLDLDRLQIKPADCRCPKLDPPKIFLPQLEQGSNLEMLELETKGEGSFLLKAHRDDLGSPSIAYRYACGEDKFRPFVRYDSFLGFAYPVLSWRYYSIVVGVWMMLAVAIGRMRSRGMF